MTGAAPAFGLRATGSTRRNQRRKARSPHSAPVSSGGAQHRPGMNTGEIRGQAPIGGGNRGAVAAGSVTTPEARASTAPRGLLARFVLAGAWVGVNDICFAIAVWTGIYQRASPQRILQAIASGLLGPASFEGGAATAALGLFLHFVVAYGWTAVFLVALLRWPALRARVTRPVGALVIGFPLPDLIPKPKTESSITPTNQFEAIQAGILLEDHLYANPSIISETMAATVAEKVN